MGGAMIGVCGLLLPVYISSASSPKKLILSKVSKNLAIIIIVLEQLKLWDRLKKLPIYITDTNHNRIEIMKSWDRLKTVILNKLKKLFQWYHIKFEIRTK